MGNWYFRLGDQINGPITRSELRYLISTGGLPSGAEVREGLNGQWRPSMGSPRKAPRTRPTTTRMDEPVSANAEISNQSVKTKPASPSTPEQHGIDKNVDATRLRRQFATGFVLAILLLLVLWWLWPEGSLGQSADTAGNATDGNQQSDSSGMTDSDGDEDSTGPGEYQVAAPEILQHPIDPNRTAPSESEGSNAGAAGDDLVEGAANESDTSEAAARLDSNSENDEANLNIMAADDLSLVRSSDPLSKFTITASGEARFFGLRATGSRFAFVVDHSGSMQGLPLQRAKDELKRCLRLLPERVEVHIIFFDDNALGSPLGYAPLNSQNRPRLNSWIDNVPVGGGTNVNVGMVEAFGDKPLPDAVFLLTDGGFDAGSPAFIRQLNRGNKVRINTVAFVSRAGEALLKTIASQNRGDYRFVP